MLHRQHRTPYILNKFDPSRSPLCQKCKTEIGTYIHCMWQCPMISDFWSSVTKELNLIFATRIEKTPGLFLLNLPDKNLSLNTSYYLLFKKLIFLARKCILFNWITDFPPTIAQWYREIFRVLPMERLCARAKNSLDMFNELWKPLFSHLPDNLATLLQGDMPPP